MLKQAIRTNEGEPMGQYIRDVMEATRRAERDVVNTDENTGILNNYMEQMRQRRVSKNDCEIIGTIVMCSCGKQVVVTDMSIGTKCTNCNGTIKIDRVIQKAYVTSTPIVNNEDLLTDGLRTVKSTSVRSASGDSWA